MTNRGWIVLIIFALLAWGTFHAVGAYQYNHNPWRAVVVVLCSLAFVGFWLAMLASRRARLEREKSPDGRQGDR
ncbi:MAG: hypothetical protein KF708_04975 [Pirellulales bacterium]|nr:hypothetical protein [Pirellulales bacterium]